MADKTVSIKNATDKELDALLMRLRKEREAQSLVGDLKRNSTVRTGYDEYVPMSVSTEEPVDSLYHFGVLGMHWGVRRDHPSSSSDGTSSDDHKKKINLKTKQPHQMTNAEMKSLVERLNLEKQLKDLSKTEMSAGRKFVTEVLYNSGKQLATTYVTKYATKGLSALLKEDISDAVDSASKEAAKAAAKKAFNDATEAARAAAKAAKEAKP